MTDKQLLETSMESPFEQFRIWYDRKDRSRVFRLFFLLQNALQWVLGVFDPALRRISQNTFTLCSSNGSSVDGRIVLLKSFNDQGFVFYTNYNSKKGQEIEANPNVQMLFYYPYPLRQIRIWGEVERTSREESEKYWNSRPRGSQLSQYISSQSEPSPEPGYLVDKMNRVKQELAGEPIPCPDHWGGYLIQPQRFEFWLGKPNRLHQRLIYEKQADGSWKKTLIQP